MVKTAYLAQVVGENREAVMAIREVPHFRNCSNDLLELVYQYGRIFSLRHGESLTRENEFDQWVYFVLSGRLVVNVGEEQVDTIASSLVGERCLLGEPRRATLSATEEGMVALGVDMALMDSLDPRQGKVHLELLSIITGEIVSRVAYLSNRQIDISSRFAMILEADAVSNIIRRLAAGEYTDEPRENMEVYKFLTREAKDLLAYALVDGGATVDTRKLYARCVNTGRYSVIADLARLIHGFLGFSRRTDSAPSAGFDACNFRDFAESVRGSINETLGTGQQDSGRKPLTDTLWLQQFRADEELVVDMVPVCRWLQATYQLDDRDAAELLMAILQNASQYTARINTSIKAMVREMSETALLSKLEAAAANPESQMVEFLSTRTPEELIPVFSKHILDVHLVNPYLEALGNGANSGNVPEGGAGEEQSPAPHDSAPEAAPADDASGQSMANTLFD